MADNIYVQPGEKAGKVLVATDDIGNIHYPLYKISYGADGSATSVDESSPLPVKLGSGDLQVDAWGTPKTSLPYSLFHGLFTFQVHPAQWTVKEDGTEVTTTAAASSGSAQSSNGALLMDAAGLTTVLVRSKRTPRYQPNRGHLYSTAVILPSPANNDERDFGLFTPENGVFFRLRAGVMYAVRRSGGVDTEEVLTFPTAMPSLDYSKGNVYDIQYQWRGVGNYKFYINLTLVHTMSLLGTLTALSVENPALPAAFLIDNTNATDSTLICGCVDISSENGSNDSLQYNSVSNEITTGTASQIPILSLFNPLTTGGVTNTRDSVLLRVNSSGNAKITLRVYATRDPAALTGEAFTAVGNGSLMYYDVTATAVVPASAQELLTFKVEANSSGYRQNPDQLRTDFYVTPGDYVIVTTEGSNTLVSATIEWGEEL